VADRPDRQAAVHLAGNSYLSFYLSYNGFGLVVASVHQQPARTLGDMAPDEQDCEGQDAAEPERDAPA
jgi:hypothetical protein